MNIDEPVGTATTEQLFRELIARLGVDPNMRDEYTDALVLLGMLKRLAADTREYRPGSR